MQENARQTPRDIPVHWQGRDAHGADGGGSYQAPAPLLHHTSQVTGSYQEYNTKYTLRWIYRYLDQADSCVS
jgi:hypothetical protein